jgi:hypothetical protein
MKKLRAIRIGETTLPTRIDAIRSTNGKRARELLSIARGRIVGFIIRVINKVRRIHVRKPYSRARAGRYRT